MQVNRGLVFWGVALITAGAVALAIQSDLVAGEIARDAWRFWPVVLIAIGIAVITASTPFALVGTLLAALLAGGLLGTLVAGIPEGINIGCGGDPDEVVTADGTFETDAAEIRLDFNCGELEVATESGSGWEVDAAYAGDAEPRIDSDADSLVVEAESDGFIGFTDARQEWAVTLPQDTTLALNLSANAATSSLDLADATLSDLSVDLNAGDVDMVLDGATVADFELEANAAALTMSVDDATEAEGTIQMNAGSLEFCAPEDALIAITIPDDNITFSHNLDDGGLIRVGDTWRTAEGEVDVVLEIEGNAASFDFNPDGGCT